LLLAFWESLATVRAEAKVPSDEDWRSAAGAVEAQIEKEDLIVFAPMWIDPVGRHHLGHKMSVDMASRMDRERFANIWEFSARGARAPESAGLDVLDEWSFGELEVRRYAHVAAKVTYDFVTKFASASTNGEAARNPAAVLEEVGFEPHRCVRIVPKPGKPFSIEYQSVPFGNLLVAHVGLADVFTRRKYREAATIRLLINGEEVASASPGIDNGWISFEAETPSETGDVTFVIESSSLDRLVCFAAEARIEAR
jgi:hypothetical protein